MRAVTSAPLPLSSRRPPTRASARVSVRKRSGELRHNAYKGQHTLLRILSEPIIYYMQPLLFSLN